MRQSHIRLYLRRCYGTKPFLSSGVPNLQLNHFTINIYLSYFKINSNCCNVISCVKKKVIKLLCNIRLVLLAIYHIKSACNIALHTWKCIICEPEQQTTFSNAYKKRWKSNLTIILCSLKPWQNNYRWLSICWYHLSHYHKKLIWSDNNNNVIGLVVNRTRAAKCLPRVIFSSFSS